MGRGRRGPSNAGAQPQGHGQDPGRVVRAVQLPRYEPELVIQEASSRLIEYCARYVGVFSDHGQWEARIWSDGPAKLLGRFDSEEAAARAYDERAKQIYQSHFLNFLPDGSPNLDRKKQLRPAG